MICTWPKSCVEPELIVTLRPKGGIRDDAPATAHARRIAPLGSTDTPYNFTHEPILCASETSLSP